MLGVQRPNRGFSLVELLVVVAILVLLISILLPSLRPARESAQAAVCLANLRQWAAANCMYAHENGGYLPRRGQGIQATTNIQRREDWFNALPPYLSATPFADLAAAAALPKPGESSMWMCPQAESDGGAYTFAYAMNMWLSTWDPPLPDRIDRVAPPAVQVLLGEGPGSYCSIVPTTHAYSPVARHNARTAIAFLDGHARAFPDRYVGCGTGDPLRPDAQWVVPNSSWPGPPP